NAEQFFSSLSVARRFTSMHRSSPCLGSFRNWGGTGRSGTKQQRRREPTSILGRLSQTQKPATYSPSQRTNTRMQTERWAATRYVKLQLICFPEVFRGSCTIDLPAGSSQT